MRQLHIAQHCTFNVLAFSLIVTKQRGTNYFIEHMMSYSRRKHNAILIIVSNTYTLRNCNYTSILRTHLFTYPSLPPSEAVVQILYKLAN